jgi:putative DNA primase/helicase
MPLDFISPATPNAGKPLETATTKDTPEETALANDNHVVPLLSTPADLQKAVEEQNKAEKDFVDDAVKEKKKRDAQKARRSAKKKGIPAQGASGRAVINVEPGKARAIADACERVLIQASAPVFRRGKALVKPIAWKTPASKGRTTLLTALQPLTQLDLMHELEKHVEFWKYDSRAAMDLPTDPPNLSTNYLLTSALERGFKPVEGVLAAPTLRPDGSILATPGYDPATLYFLALDAGLTLPEDMPDHPTREDAEKALALLSGLLDGFPLCTDTDRAVALSGLISPVVRGCLERVPLHAFTAPTAGTGKSYLADVASAIAVGRWCPVANAGKNEEETEKRLVGLLLGGYQIISIDNVSDGLGGDFLCQAVERPSVRVRPLGTSGIMEIENRAVMFATGNNLVIVGDMARRSIMARLDSGMARPEEREFSFDPVELVQNDRGKYLAAALTIVRAYILAGRPGQMKPLASFEAWSDNVRSALVWLGCPDPAASIETVRDSDPQLNTLKTVLDSWWTLYQGERMKAGDVVKDLDGLPVTDPLAGPKAALREALMPVCGRGSNLDGLRLGHWLRKNQGRPIPTGAHGSSKFTAGTMSGGSVRWVVERSV